MRTTLHHISYATANFSQAAYLLARSARRFGINPRIYGPGDAVIADLRHRFPTIMATKRGAGLWLWKPFIIRDTLAAASDGDLVLYTDVAMTFIADPAPLLRHAGDTPIVLFEHNPRHLQGHWTKRDCFVRLAADTPDFWYAAQLCAGFQLYRAGPEARAFIAAVCDAMVQDGVLSDDANTAGLPDLPGFGAHRHDQSVLTIVARKFRLPVFPDPSQYGPCAPRAAENRPADGVARPASRYGQVFHLHRMRDCGRLHFLTRRLRRRYTKSFFV